MIDDAEYVEVEGPIDASGFIGYVHVSRVPWQAFALLPGTRARTLSADRDTVRAAYFVALPAGYSRSAAAIAVDASVDLIVVSGALDFGGQRLGPNDFAFVPTATAVPAMRTAAGAELLLFADPPPVGSAAVKLQQASGVTITRFDARAWREASIARAAGLELALEVQTLKQDPATTARTWYVRQAAGGIVPWERHSVVEEGFLIAGEYRLAERLPGRTLIGDYRPGGYFRRPPGIVHSGPRSGTRTGATWLLRTPAALDVAFMSD